MEQCLDLFQRIKPVYVRLYFWNFSSFFLNCIEILIIRPQQNARSKEIKRRNFGFASDKKWGHLSAKCQVADIHSAHFFAAKFQHMLSGTLSLTQAYS